MSFTKLLHITNPFCLHLYSILLFSYLFVSLRLYIVNQSIWFTDSCRMEFMECVYHSTNFFIGGIIYIYIYIYIYIFFLVYHSTNLCIPRNELVFHSNRNFDFCPVWIIEIARRLSQTIPSSWEWPKIYKTWLFTRVLTKIESTQWNIWGSVQKNSSYRWKISQSSWFTQITKKKKKKKLPIFSSSDQSKMPEKFKCLSSIWARFFSHSLMLQIGLKTFHQNFLTKVVGLCR